MPQKFKHIIIYYSGIATKWKFGMFLRQEILPHVLKLMIVPYINLAGIHQKFEHNTISLFCKMFRSVTEFGYFSMVHSVTLFIKLWSLYYTHNFTEMHQKFEWVVIYCLLKMSQIKFWFFFFFKCWKDYFFFTLRIVIIPYLGFTGTHKKN